MERDNQAGTCPDCHTGHYVFYTSPKTGLTKKYCKLCGHGIESLDDP